MPHRHLSALVFAGLEHTTAATLASLLGDDALPEDLHFVQHLNIEPWRTNRTGLLVVGMTPNTDLLGVSQLIQNRTSYWDVAVCLPEVLNYYSIALLAQGAIKVLPHPEEDLETAKVELRFLLESISSLQSEAFGLELADLIQLFGEKRIAKTVRLTGTGCVGSVYLHGGIVMHAETTDGEEGMEAFSRLITLESPELRVHKGCLTDRKTIGIPAMTCLLEGSRQRDEARVQDTIPAGNPDSFDSLDGVPTRDSLDGVPRPPRRPIALD